MMSYALAYPQHSPTFWEKSSNFDNWNEVNHGSVFYVNIWIVWRHLYQTIVGEMLNYYSTFSLSLAIISPLFLMLKTNANSTSIVGDQSDVYTVTPIFTGNISQQWSNIDPPEPAANFTSSLPHPFFSLFNYTLFICSIPMLWPFDPSPSPLINLFCYGFLLLLFHIKDIAQHSTSRFLYFKAFCTNKTH